MDSNTFDIIYNKWINKDKTKKSFWKEISQSLDYDNPEYLRSEFKNERKRRGLFNKENKIEDNFPKVCIFDIEFAPMKVFTFGLWDQNITPDKVINSGYVLCWSAKLLNNSNVILDVILPEEKDNDERIVTNIHKLLNSCDILIGHNIKEYDLKVLNTRFLYHGLSPLHQHQIVDTLSVARSNFAFPSNSLKYVNKFLGIKQKDETKGFKLWEECVNGNANSLKELGQYCKNDVLATEELYYKFRPFVKSHPNLALYFETDEMICRHCGSKNVINDGFYYTNIAKYQSIHCSDCGAWGRKNENLVSKEQRKTLRR